MNNISFAEIKIVNEKGIFSIQDLIQQIKDRASKELPVCTILHMYLFGSYARNEANKESDVDICVIYDETKISEMDINLTVDNITNDLLGQYGVITNILCFNNSYYQKYKDNSKLFCNIRRDGLEC